MAKITLKGNSINTNGDLPAVGTQIPDMTFTRADLSEVKLSDFKKRRVLSIFPSVDTAVCAKSVHVFNEQASSLDNVEVLNISSDLPFAFKRFCGAEGLENVETLSTFRSDAASKLGVQILEGPFAGLCARAVIVIDEAGKVIHSELVPEIVDEVDYDAALAVLK